MVERDGEAVVAVIEGEEHALSGSEAGASEPDVGELHPGHVGFLKIGRGSVVGRVAEDGCGAGAGMGFRA